MATQNDSFECDIWNYKPALQKQAKSLPGTEDSNNARIKGNKKKGVRHGRSSVNIKEKAPSKVFSSNCKTQDEVEQDKDSKHNVEKLQIIDVDLEPDKGLSYNNKMSLPESSNQVKSCTYTNLSWRSSNALEISKNINPPHAKASSSKTQVQKRSSSNLTLSKSPISKSRRVSSSPKSKTSDDKPMLSIASYFSPKKVSSIKAEDINHPTEDFIDLSDEDFKERDAIKETGRQMATGGDSHIGQKQPEEISNVGQNSQNMQESPLVNVDVIIEDEGEQLSFELENRSGVPPDEELDISERFYSERHSSEKKVDSRESNVLMQVCRGPMLTNIISSSNKNEITEKKDIPSCLELQGNNSDKEDLFSEDEDSAQNKKFNNYEEAPGTSPSYSHSPSFNRIDCNRKGGIDLTESGGFLPEDDTPEMDSNPRENKEKVECLKSTPEKVPLVSCTTWPTMVSSASATKQTTLFSFLKAKPRVQSSLNHETFFPKLTKSVSESHGKVGGSSAGTNSFSSSWKSQNSEDAIENNTYGKKKSCPFYKKMPGTPITVDAFRYGVIPGCEAYVLTHFHYDHYGGLTKKFAQPIFCSQVTGNLVESRIGVHNKWINCLPMWKPCKVANATLTLMEANHCPGAVIILFELKDGRKILHTGDFRANHEMESYSALQGIKISELYLDTTYCNPSYAFPDQAEVVNFVVDLVLSHISDHPSTLIVCGAYTIGKERIFQAIAKALDSKVCVMNDKKKVLDCLEDPDLKSRVTLDWSAGRVHVLPMGKLNQQHLREHLTRHHHFKSILAFQPTGWTHSDKQTSLSQLKPKWSKDGITLYGVPYSEHSSFLELKRFVQHFRPLKILPTVNNGSPAARSKMEALFKQWMQEKTMRK